jgi:hypothetical protein
MRIEQGLYTLISTQSPEIVGLRIYPNQLPQGVVYPAVSYERLATTQNALLNGVDTLTNVTVGFDIWADSLSECHTIADQLRTLLNGHQGDLGGKTVQYVQFIGESSSQDIDGDFKKFMVSIDFTITLHE